MRSRARLPCSRSALDAEGTRAEAKDNVSPFEAALKAIMDPDFAGVSSLAHSKRLLKVVDMATQAPAQQLVVLAVRPTVWPCLSAVCGRVFACLDLTCCSKSNVRICC